MTTPSEILDEAGDETEVCPECKGKLGYYEYRESSAGAWLKCLECNGSGVMPKPKADQPSTRSVWLLESDTGIYSHEPCLTKQWAEDVIASKKLGAVYRPVEYVRAALSAIPQPAEVVGPAWRDKPDAEGWWLSRTATGPCVWFQAADEAHGIIYTPEELARLPFVARWFGPVRIPEDKAGA
jgi:uncharacterized protein YbaR (Trm112 family)